MNKNIPTLIVLSPALTAVQRVSCTQVIGRFSRKSDPCRKLDPGFESYYRFFSKMMDQNQLPYVDLLNILLDYSKENEISALYRNTGKDIHHYSTTGHAILAKAISNRFKTTKEGKIILKNNSNDSIQ